MEWSVFIMNHNLCQSIALGVGTQIKIFSLLSNEST